MTTRTIINRSFPVFALEMEAAFEEGYRIDHNNLPTMWGVCYEAVLIKPSNDLGMFALNNENTTEIVEEFSSVETESESPKRKAGRPFGTTKDKI